MRAERARSKRLQRVLALEDAIRRAEAARLAALVAEDSGAMAAERRGVAALSSGIDAPLAALVARRLAGLQAGRQALGLEQAKQRETLAARTIRLRQAEKAAALAAVALRRRDRSAAMKVLSDLIGARQSAGTQGSRKAGL